LDARTVMRLHPEALLYSTSWSKGPSRGLARKLGLRQFGADLHVT